MKIFCYRCTSRPLMANLILNIWNWYIRTNNESMQLQCNNCFSRPRLSWRILISQNASLCYWISTEEWSVLWIWILEVLFDAKSKLLQFFLTSVFMKKIIETLHWFIQTFVFMDPSEVYRNGKLVGSSSNENADIFLLCLK